MGEDRSCEIALLGADLTLGTWVFTLIPTILTLIGIDDWPVSLSLWMVAASLILHGPIVCMQIAGLFMMRGGPGHAPLTTFFLLNIVNTLAVLGMLGLAIHYALLG